MWLEKDFLQHVYASVALKLDNARAHAPQDGTKWSREAARTGPEQTPASVQIQSISQCDQRQMCSIKRGERERERDGRVWSGTVVENLWSLWSCLYPGDREVNRTGSYEPAEPTHTAAGGGHPSLLLFSLLHVNWDRDRTSTRCSNSSIKLCMWT